MAAAVIIEDHRLFATQRGYGEWKDYWEFPGGKIEAGESAEEALVREIREELDTEIRVGRKLAGIEYDYPSFHLSMECFFAEVLDGSLVLKEHEAARWLGKDELDEVRWLPADLELIEMLKETKEMKGSLSDAVRRIQYYEEKMDRCTDVIKHYQAALEALNRIQKDVEELSAYYESPEWRRDFEADERGELPRNLKRGVLSEDGIDHLLDDYQELKDRI